MPIVCGGHTSDLFMVGENGVVVMPGCRLEASKTAATWMNTHPH